jgi:hypothetical protein
VHRRLEPHENMFPGLERLPPMSLRQQQGVRAAHWANGECATTRSRRPRANGSTPTLPVRNPSRLRYFAVPLAGALTVETRASAKRWFGCDAPEVFQAAEHALDEIVSASIRAIAATTGTTGWQTASWSSRS